MISEFLTNRRASRLAKTAVKHLEKGETSFSVNNNPFDTRPHTYSHETYDALAEKLDVHNIALAVRRCRVPAVFGPNPFVFDRITVSTAQPPDLSDPAYAHSEVFWPSEEL